MTITEAEVIKNLKAALVVAVDENQKLKQEIERNASRHYNLVLENVALKDREQA